MILEKKIRHWTLVGVIICLLKSSTVFAVSSHSLDTCRGHHLSLEVFYSFCCIFSFILYESFLSHSVLGLANKKHIWIHVY